MWDGKKVERRKRSLREGWKLGCLDWEIVFYVRCWFKVILVEVRIFDWK